MGFPRATWVDFFQEIPDAFWAPKVATLVCQCGAQMIAVAWINVTPCCATVFVYVRLDVHVLNWLKPHVWVCCSICMSVWSGEIKQGGICSRLYWLNFIVLQSFYNPSTTRVRNIIGHVGMEVVQLVGMIMTSVDCSTTHFTWQYSDQQQDHMRYFCHHIYLVKVSDMVLCLGGGGSNCELSVWLWTLDFCKC
jgi:hypothetical protein